MNNSLRDFLLPNLPNALQSIVEGETNLLFHSCPLLVDVQRWMLDVEHRLYVLEELQGIERLRG